MKAAAAVLGASLLFFLGVLTGAGRREAIPPPAAIPLGVGTSASPAEGPTPPQSTQSTSRATAPAAGSNPSTATTATTTRTDATAPPAPANDATSTSTTGGPGQVEKVDNEVDCRPAGKPGKGKREPCPSTTTSAETPGGGGNR